MKIKFYISSIVLVYLVSVGSISAQNRTLPNSITIQNNKSPEKENFYKESLHNKQSKENSCS